MGDPYADLRKELYDPYADMRRELKDHEAEMDADMKKFFHNYQTMKESTHKNNLKIGKKISRGESFLSNPKQVLLSKKDLMINN